MDRHLPIVLRRRAKDVLAGRHLRRWLDRDHIASQLSSAADELAVRQICTGGDEQIAVEAIADNRRLRGVLVKIHNTIERKSQEAEDIRQALAAVRPFGEGRIILTVQIGDTDLRADIEARVAALLDGHFTERGTDGDKETESAGCDAAEREGVEQADRESGDADGAADRAAEGATREDRGCGSPAGAAD